MLLGCHVALATKRPLQSAALADRSEPVPTRWYLDTTAKTYVIGTLVPSRLVEGIRPRPNRLHWPREQPMRCLAVHREMRDR